MTTVAVLGGGVAGLTTAHELADRGFDVTVYEGRKDEFGGKARSMPVPGSGVGGRGPLPAEHGFRFIPGFYRHLPDTMARIPNGAGTVLDHLTEATRMLLAQGGGKPDIVAVTGPPTSLDDLAVTIEFLHSMGQQLGVPLSELVWFSERLMTLLCSCDERRFGEWELMSWWQFTDADNKSPAFQRFLADGMTRTLVAAQAREMSARTGGLILWQLLFDLVRVDGQVDRLLNGPTSEVWIDPWITCLQNKGAVLRNDCEVIAIDCDGTRITGVTVTGDAGAEQIVADFYVAAVPVDCLIRLLTPALTSAEPRLATLPNLVTRWMTGAMFYLAHDVPLVHGHAIFVDSAWALTAVSQAQFWPSVDLALRGDGRVEGILSVDISDWDRKSTRFGLPGLSAKECTRSEILQEVWAQLVDHIDDGSLNAANVVEQFLDPAIQFDDPTPTVPNPVPRENQEPLLVNSTGSWNSRPDAVTAIPNFFLAADFVRTTTDLATMEGANEAARRAVNGILDATHSVAPRCQLFPPREPGPIAAIREADKLLWKLGKASIAAPMLVNENGQVQLTGPFAAGSPDPVHPFS